MSWNRWNNRKKRLREQRLLLSCESLSEDDGKDPRQFFRSEFRPKHNRKTLQLCGQVGKMLNCLLWESEQPLLYDLMVEEVMPAPDASRMQVILRPASDEKCADPASLLACLDRLRPRFKEEIAQAIHRKRAPDLVFQVMFPEAPLLGGLDE